MSESYAREILRRNVAQICQTIGWNGINSTPLDILVHVLEKYIHTLGTQANRHAEQFNRTEPNLHDLGLVLRDLHVQIPELIEYTRCVPPIPPPTQIDVFPRPKDSNLNFLKPGSYEVVTRPMYVHEHLPPMYPEKEQDTPVVAGTVEIRQNGLENIDNNSTICTSPDISVTDSPEKSKDIFKRPIDPIVQANIKRPRIRLDEEERTREISSVMMTMSGFLSPAREGKLPEARPPVVVSEKHHDKHKSNSHHAIPPMAPILDKTDKKSKKSKLLNGKIMKNKRKDKSHKSENSKSKDGKIRKHPPGHVIDMKPKDGQQVPNHLPVPKVPPPLKPVRPPPPVIVPEPMKIKQEPVDVPLPPTKNTIPGEEAIPVPLKIPISKSPLVSTTNISKNPSNLLISDVEIKKEVIEEEEKLASQPDRSKINIFKRISNKSKEDKSVPEVVPEKSQSDSMISKHQNSTLESTNVKVKTEESVVNNNDTTAVDLSRDMDLRAHEVINIDDDSLDKPPTMQSKPLNLEPQPSLSINKSLQLPIPKDVASVSPKIKKEKKHKDKKDKLAKLQAKLLKKQQQQLAHEMGQGDKQNVKLGSSKPSKRPRREEKWPALPPGFPFFPSAPPGRNMMPGPGLIPNNPLIPGGDFLNLANNPALRGLPSPNLLAKQFGLGAGGPGLIPGPYLPGALGPGMPNTLMQQLGNFPHAPRPSSTKIPPMLRRPSLEVIPVDNDEDRGGNKPNIMSRDKERHDKHKSQTIPNILQKHKSKYKNAYKMPPVQPDITIELNPPKVDTVKQEPIRDPTPLNSPTPEPHSLVELQVESIKKEASLETFQNKEVEITEKKKDKSHKKEKKDKDGIKIKKKKDKKDKSKDKSEKKRDKEEKQEFKEKLKKEKKEKKKLKTAADGLVPKLTLKLSSSNSNSPMPPSSPDVFKLNIKPVMKKEEEPDSPIKEDPISREHSRSPELAQISALVTRPPKQKHSKHNHSTEVDAPSTSPTEVSSPPRKNRPPSSHSKHKRILFKPMSKKGHFDDEIGTTSDETPAAPPESSEKPTGPLPTPFYVNEHGDKIWVCPACGRPDNGSPMIGCDGCDGWYHWVCVGITEEPGATEDWFCKSCIAKRTAMMLGGGTLSSGKKRGRKPKVEKVRDCH